MTLNGGFDLHDEKKKYWLFKDTGGYYLQIPKDAKNCDDHRIKIKDTKHEQDVRVWQALRKDISRWLKENARTV